MALGVLRPIPTRLIRSKKCGYVEVQKRRLFPIELSREVHKVLSSKQPALFEIPFTAAMESALNEIAVGQRESKAYLKAFCSRSILSLVKPSFRQWLRLDPARKRHARPPHAPTGKRLAPRRATTPGQKRRARRAGRAQALPGSNQLIPTFSRYVTAIT